MVGTVVAIHTRTVGHTQLPDEPKSSHRTKPPRCPYKVPHRQLYQSAAIRKRGQLFKVVNHIYIRNFAHGAPVIAYRERDVGAAKQPNDEQPSCGEIPLYAETNAHSLARMQQHSTPA